MYKKIKALGLITAVSLGLLVGCAGGEGSEQASVSTADIKPFVATYSTDFISISPLADVSAGTKSILRNMHDAVYKYNSNGDLELSLADNIQIDSDGTYLIFTIELKDNLKFHNGKAITAQDIKYSYERLALLIPESADEIKGGGYFPNLLNGDTSKGFAKGRIEIINDKMVKCYLDDNYGVLTTMHTLADGFIVPCDYSEKEQKTKPIGAGPYKFVSYSEGDKIVFTRFDEYHGKKPDIKDVEFRKYADSSVLFLAFQTGEIDILSLNNESLKAIKNFGYYIHEGLSNDVRVVYMNNERDRFSDVRIRQAFHYAIDKSKINQIAVENRGAVLYSHMSPVLSKYYNEEIESLYPVDKAKAKQLLAEAGYPDGFTVKFHVVGEDTIGQDYAAIIKSELAQVGVNLEIEAVPWNTYLESIYRGRDYDIAILNIVGYPDPSRVLSRYGSTSSGNMGNYKNEEVDKLLKSAYNTTDQEKEAVEIYKQIQKILAQDATALWTVDPGVVTALSKDYIGYKNYPFAFTDISLIKHRR